MHSRKIPRSCPETLDGAEQSRGSGPHTSPACILGSSWHFIFAWVEVMAECFEGLDPAYMFLLVALTTKFC